MLIILNVPFIGIWAKVARVPARILVPIILLCCLIGAYSANNSGTDVVMMAIFGIVGFVLRKFEYELAPLILALLLGPLLETNLRNSLTLSDGSFAIFFTRPISVVVMVIVFILLALAVRSALKKPKRRTAGVVG
jgi:putative tricarboxylic transport membrane protein